MPLYSHTLSDGRQIQIDLKRRAKKNLILRPVDDATVSISIPPSLRPAVLEKWLSEHENLLLDTLARAASAPASKGLPERIWYRGIPKTPVIGHGTDIGITHTEIHLPQAPQAELRAQLSRFLKARAQEYLPELLERHAAQTGLHPAAIALTDAKTFWGVCRRSGIRLNWRLIGAPGYVADYICIHELCHIPHPNHSPAFWAQVNRLTPHTAAAEQWLKQHGRELFALG